MVWPTLDLLQLIRDDSVHLVNAHRCGLNLINFGIFVHDIGWPLQGYGRLLLHSGIIRDDAYTQD
jgi:hypothetical protein